ncbi:MAG: S-layer homology domain-containing protein [Chloroflexota bacterium]
MKKRSLLNTIIVLMGFTALIAVPWSVPAGLAARTGAYVPAVLADPADWPMYGHDPQRTNYNPAETTISAGNVNQLVQRWAVNLGYNSTGSATSGAPSVANGKVYVGTNASTGDNFFARDAVTGAPVWSTSVGYVNSCFNVGIGSTSAISGSVLSVGGGDSAFYGLNANTGAQLWRNPMNVGSSGFPWESPLLAYDRSYLGIASRCDNPSVRGEVRSVDMNTGGSPISQYFVPSGQAGGGIWNSPALSVDGSTLVVVTGEDYSINGPDTRALVSLDPLTLAILQSNQQGATGNDLDFGTTPLFFSDNQNRVLAGANHKNGVFYAYVVSNINGGPLWSRSTGTVVGAMPAYDPTYGSGGTLFILGSGSRLYAVDPATGVDRWPSVTVGSTHGNIAIANGLIFINNGTGGLRILDETNGALLRTITPSAPGAANSGVAVSHGFVYWLTAGTLNAWSLPAGGPTSTPTNTAGPTNTTLATNTPTATNSVVPSNTPISTSTPAPTNTPVATGTQTAIPSATATSTNPPGTPTSGASTTPNPTGTSTSVPATVTSPAGTVTQPAPTNTGTTMPTSTPTACTITFSDVAEGSTFYPFIRCLACRGIINGYPDGTFRPNNNVTSGQLAKIVANAAEFNDPPAGQSFEDVLPGSTFYAYIERLFSRGIMSGYPCGGVGEPCGAGNLPYFRPNSNATRGQISKIVSNAAGFTDPAGSRLFEDVLPGSTFYDYIQRLASRNIMSGYPCGGVGEPCGVGNLPYFRPNANATRGQTSKIVGNTFFPDCQTPSRRENRP